jgi:hypothetical protein
MQIKKMIKFFDNLYITREVIGENVISEWSHKEQPIEVFAVLEQSELNEETIPSEEGKWYTTKEEAEEFIFENTI